MASTRKNDKDQPLIDDIRLLGRLLGDTVREQEGAAVFDIVERVRQTAVRFARDGAPAVRAELAALLEAHGHHRLVALLENVEGHDLRGQRHEPEREEGEVGLGRGAHGASVRPASPPGPRRAISWGSGGRTLGVSTALVWFRRVGVDGIRPTLAAVHDLALACHLAAHPGVAAGKMRDGRQCGRLLVFRQADGHVPECVCAVA